ncbi:hypothetical protein SNEBB_000501, partial [Seison nebaliae]
MTDYDLKFENEISCYHEKLVRDNAERDKVRNFVEKKLKEKKLLR